MIISQKIKTVDNKIKQNKVQDNLDKQTAKISALSSGNVSKNKRFTGKEVLPERDQVAKKWYQGLNKYCKSDKKKEPVIIKKIRTNNDRQIKTSV